MTDDFQYFPATVFIDGELDLVADGQGALHGPHVQDVAAAHLHILHLHLVVALKSEYNLKPSGGSNVGWSRREQEGAQN